MYYYITAILRHNVLDCIQVRVNVV